MCGIAGVISTTPAVYSLYKALYALQHRGQESAGIFTWDGENVHKYKGYGLVCEVFTSDIMETLTGNVGIGHVRYPTTGGSKPENIQPFHFMFHGHQLSMVHNGNLINTESLRYEYESRGHTFSSTSDTEIIGTILANELVRGTDVRTAVAYCMRVLSGSYSVIFMLDGEIFGFRDPLGIKPFCIGKTKTGYILASESAALDSVEADLVRDVAPGELVSLSADGVSSVQIIKNDAPAHCVFEYIYFARPDSVIDGISVYDVRRKTGERLSQEVPLFADLVSPVPDSGTAAAWGYANKSGIPFREALIKNRYTGRTFILPNQEKREIAVRMKLNPIRHHISGKTVILVDDSIVRGTTSKKILGLVKEFGAAKIHLRVASPPIIAPCYLGTDFPSRKELIAAGKTTSEVKQEIGADSLAHISLDGLIEAIGLPKNHLCLGCLTGIYPLDIEGEQSNRHRLMFCRKKKWESVLP